MKSPAFRVFAFLGALFLLGAGEARAQGLSVSNASVTEGNSGTKNLTFTVTRNGSTAAVTFDYATSVVAAAPGVYPASVGADFVAASGNATIAAGVDGASTTVIVQVAGDT